MSNRSRERYMRYRRGIFSEGLPVISVDELKALTPEGMKARYAGFLRAWGWPRQSRKSDA